MQEYVKERLGIGASDSSRSTLIGRTINAEYLAAAVRSEATLQAAAFTLTNGQPDVYMGADVAKVKGIIGGDAGRLTPVTVSRFTFLVANYNDDAPLGPMYYMVLQPGAVLQVRVWPTPTVTDATGTAFLVTRPAVLAAGADVPLSIPAEFHHAVIGERAVQRIALAEQETALAGTAGALADEAFLALVQHVRDRNGELDAAVRVTGDVGQPTGVVLGQATR